MTPQLLRKTVDAQNRGQEEVIQFVLTFLHEHRTHSKRLLALTLRQHFDFYKEPCYGCSRWLPESMFWRHVRRPGTRYRWRQTYCKACFQMIQFYGGRHEVPSEIWADLKTQPPVFTPRRPELVGNKNRRGKRGNNGKGPNAKRRSLAGEHHDIESARHGTAAAAR